MTSSVFMLLFAMMMFQEQSITITASDFMRFEPAQITVNAGASVNLTLHNKGRIGTLKHNFVLVKNESDIEAIGNVAASKDGEVPEDMRNRTIAISAFAGPGQKVTVSFTAPAAGTYYFFSSYPGSSAVMRGKFISQ